VRPVRGNGQLGRITLAPAADDMAQAELVADRIAHRSEVDVVLGLSRAAELILSLVNLL
jgi:hypothetical protein